MITGFVRGVHSEYVDIEEAAGVVQYGRAIFRI